MQSADLRPGIIQYFFKHSIIDGGKKYTLVSPVWTDFIVILINSCAALGISFPRFGVPTNLTVLVQRLSCLSMQRLMGKFVSGYDIVSDERVMFVMPLAKKFKL